MLDRCFEPPTSLRDAGTCVRGTPGCHVPHALPPEADVLPTIRQTGGNGPVNP